MPISRSLVEVPHTVFYKCYIIYFIIIKSFPFIFFYSYILIKYTSNNPYTKTIYYLLITVKYDKLYNVTYTTHIVSGKLKPMHKQIAFLFPMKHYILYVLYIIFIKYHILFFHAK